jgi:hypothetical protein
VVPDEVVLDLNVLRLVLLNWIMSNLDGTLIVTQEWNLVTMKSIILQGLPHPKELSTITHGRHILGFDGGETHTILLLIRPTNQGPTKKFASPKVDFLSTLSPVQSESEYPTRSNLDSFGYQRPKVGV